MMRNAKTRITFCKWLAAVCVILFPGVACIFFGDASFANEPTDESGAAAEVYVEPPLTDSDRDHWSLKPRKPIQIPSVRSRDWPRNPIDFFVAEKLEQLGLAPQQEASRQILIRRVSLNLTGLLPSQEEVERFENDDSAEAFELLVDRLLASSAYGERWAQHWLDLARFAETDGFEHDHVRPNAWRYRDWVIDALNADLPYDRFVQLQIAGDLLEPDNPAAAVATQFCVSGPDMPDINSQDERRHTLLNEMTSAVGEVMLGLQIGCAQCHDHKYDPVSQADFYRLRAIFEPAVQLKKNSSLTALSETGAYERTSHLMIRGDYRRPGHVLTADVPRVLQQSVPFAPGLIPASPSGRRVAFAQWLVDPRHPLTARVIVNRVWQYHFGTGLCETPSDLGIMGAEPSNQPLLDWLADWFVNNNWSLKKLHRLIASSATYRQRSGLPAEASFEETAAWKLALARDPDAKRLSRFPRQRLSGEVIRDTMLQISGLLNRRAGGPGVRPPLPAELRGTLLKDQWEVTPDEHEHHRRSVFIFARRNLRFPIFETFDRPAANESCSGRHSSTTATQALHLLNSEFSLKIATSTANELRRQFGNQEQQIDAAFTQILGRGPSAADRHDAAQFLAESENDGLTYLCLSLMNCNEFLFIE